MKTESGFWQKLFREFHARNRVREPATFRDYKDIRMALYSLRTFTGMTSAQIAQRIGLMPHALNLLEMRGGVLRFEQCQQCRVIALDFRYPKLAEFFKFEGMKNAQKRRNRTGGTDLSNIEHWQD